MLAALVDGEVRELEEVARTGVSVHYETGNAAVPLLSVGTPDAWQLPNSLITSTLPGTGSDAASHRITHGSTVGGGAFRHGGATWVVHRWWLPPRPHGLRPPRLGSTSGREISPRPSGVPRVRPSYDGLDPTSLLGAGPGLTPAGDDVLAGALVAAQATDDPRLPDWRASVLQLLRRRPTTAVSEAMLRCALDGFATPQLADYVHAMCTAGTHTDPDVLDAATVNLLAVGSSSGAALMAGVLHTLTTAGMREAA